MRTPIGPELLSEVVAHRLRFNCEHCAYFESRGQTCSEGYPNHEHLSARLVEGRTVVFCKRFELW